MDVNLVSFSNSVLCVTCDDDMYMSVFTCVPCSEWSAIEKEMGDGLQSAGHHMDA